MPLFDLHCDTLYECYTKNYPLFKNEGHVDLTRLLQFAPSAQVFAAWVPDDLRGDAAWEFCCKLLRSAAEYEAQHKMMFHLLRKGEKLHSCLDQCACVGMLAVEGGAALGGDLRRVSALSELGVRYLTLTWNGSNELGNGCLSQNRGGLTPFGKEAVSHLFDAGILADVSHLNERGFWDVAERVEGPFIASHSNASAVYKHPRNLTDHQFREIVEHGGLVGLNLCEAFLGEQTFECFERHLYHFLSLGGADVVCLGCDMDGTTLPSEWGGVSVVSQIFAYLCRKNYDNRLLQKIFFGNCYNFFDLL